MVVVVVGACAMAAPCVSGSVSVAGRGVGRVAGGAGPRLSLSGGGGGAEEVVAAVPAVMRAQREECLCGTAASLVPAGLGRADGGVVRMRA